MKKQTQSMDLFFSIKISLYYSLIISDLILSNKISLRDINGVKTEKLNECRRCKILTSSFDHWLDKTSRGKFEGGDAAWEESKLKSYARSEIRLVEIQEGLCSELKKNQDICYAVAEEAEMALEKWWFHEDPHGVDLYTWLCIENLKRCCPQNHFGENCELCLLDKTNKICSGHGHCSGEGTRNGNGSCICHPGYIGSSCQDCDENFFSNSLGNCEPCHRSCKGCSAAGAETCKACNSGWNMENGICVDVDECLDHSACEINQFCINKEGSYTCKLCDNSCRSCVGGGSANCTSCEGDSELWSGVCVDSELKQQLLADTLHRNALYFGLIVLTLFISRSSRLLGSLIVIMVACFVYFAEKTSRMTTWDILANLYF